jgi:hypothetical protein
VGVDRGGDERVELRLVEEANVLIGVGCRRLLGRPTQVFDHPAVSKRELEDAVQEAEIVTCALDRLTAHETGKQTAAHPLDRNAAASQDASIRTRARVSAFAEDRLNAERAGVAVAARRQKWLQRRATIGVAQLQAG